MHLFACEKELQADRLQPLLQHSPGDSSLHGWYVSHCMHCICPQRTFCVRFITPEEEPKARCHLCQNAQLGDVLSLGARAPWFSTTLPSGNGAPMHAPITRLFISLPLFACHASTFKWPAYFSRHTYLAGIHPRIKKPVGYRLAAAAIVEVYNHSGAYTGPTISGCSTSGKSLVVKMDSTLLAGTVAHVCCRWG